MGVTPEERRVAERRTQALRGPGAGGFTPATSMAASNPCLNCGTNIQLEHCPECGQRAIDPDPTLREFLQELAQELLNWDGKLYTTFRLLVTKPGELTEEYLAGKRVRYISPLRLYLTCSVLYFFVAAFIPERSVDFTVTGSESTRGGARVSDSVATQQAIASLDSASRAGGGLDGALKAKLSRAVQDRKVLAQRVTSAIPTTMWVLLPIFAALVGIAFRDRRRHYPQHLAFALHVHAMLFLVLLITVAGRLAGSEIVGSALTLLVGAGMGMYVLKAAHRVYGGAQAGVLARMSAIFVAYGLAFVLAMLLTFGVIVLSY